MEETVRAAVDAAGAPVLSVDVGALAANWRLLADRAGPSMCGAVVKANAYGCGIEIAVPALRAAGCGTFFVAHLSEARRTRAVAPDATIYVLHGLPPGSARLYHGLDVRPVLGSAAEVAEWRAEGGGQPAALHVDTGMNRLGLRMEDARALAGSDMSSGLTVSLLMSHFVSSEVPEAPVTARQIADFEQLRAAFPAIPASLANSAGIFLNEAPHYDLVRPGYALYGGNPIPGRDNPMRPVVRLEAPVVAVRDVPDGETVGYNGEWRAEGLRRIAVIAAGYADGLDRRASGSTGLPGGYAVAAGQLCPIAGRVSMDLVTVDITALPVGAVSRGDRIALIDDQLTVDKVATQLGTIGYEVLTGLAARVQRVAVAG